MGYNSGGVSCRESAKHRDSLQCPSACMHLPARDATTTIKRTLRDGPLSVDLSIVFTRTRERQPVNYFFFFSVEVDSEENTLADI